MNEGLASAGDDSQPKVVFTLLHGTFANRADWTQPGSAIHEHLTRQFPGCVVTAPTWSGENSQEARAEGAVRLRYHLYLQRRTYPHAHQFVVSHSHGGNIALHACTHEDVRRSLSGIVTLGTPFIHARRRNLETPIKLFKSSIQLWKILFWALMGISCLTTFFIVAAVLMFVYDKEELFPLWLTITFLTALAISLTLVAFMAIRSLRDKAAGRGCAASVMRLARPKQGQLLRSLALPYAACEEVDLLTFSVSADEAQLWLRTLWRVGGFAHFVHEVITSTLLPALALTCVMAVVNFGINHLKHPNTRYWQFFDQNVLKPLLGLGIFLFLAVLLAFALILVIHALMVIWPAVRYHRFAFGDGSLLANWLLDIHAKDSPGSGPRWTFRRARAPSWHNFRKHSSFYSDPTTLKELGQWIGWRMGLPGYGALSGHAPEPSRDDRALVRLASILMLAGLAYWLLEHPEVLIYGR